MNKESYSVEAWIHEDRRATYKLFNKCLRSLFNLQFRIFQSERILALQIVEQCISLIFTLKAMLTVRVTHLFQLLEHKHQSEIPV